MRKTYVGKEVDVSFDPEVCIHAAKCVRGLPAVFDTSASRGSCPTPRQLTTLWHR